MAAGRIAIAGAGIGGLAAAIALARAGFEVVVLERALALEEAGAGVQLAANATRSLNALGLYERVAARAVRPEALEIVNGLTGEMLSHAPLGAKARKRFGAPFLVIHRADLQAALLEAARAEPSIGLLLGRTVEDVEERPDGITVRCSHAGLPEEHDAIALIGADGLRSNVRRRLGMGRDPSFRHRAAWRATVAAEDLPPHLAAPTVRLWLGPRAHLVSYPVRAGAAVNLVAVTPDERTAHGWGASAAREELVEHFEGWSADAQTLLATPDHWLRWALFDLPPLRRWGKGRVTLLGDAAHAMLPFLAQGAAQALEDAVVLGRSLRAGRGDIVAALRRYENQRRARTARVQRAARGMDRIYHLSGPARLLRDLVLRSREGEAAMERYGWIYRWKP
ncbi:FAD-dependent monooxygenase [Ancylobacter terrae]|uniref:FAD-dependent monooxygenase n=1 Tax=Ancylobacter sp. sgz301288 TaxID=3342077 RepID=UPI0038597065